MSTYSYGWRSIRIGLGGLAMVLANSAVVQAQSEDAVYPEHFDRRLSQTKAPLRPQTAPQTAARDSMRQRLPHALVSGGQDMLTPFSVISTSGALTAPSDTPADEVAMAFLEDNAAVFGLSKADLSLELTDRVVTKQTGVVHEYYRQTDPKTNLPVFYTQAQFHSQKGSLLLANVGLSAISKSQITDRPAITAAEALGAAGAFFGLSSKAITMKDARVAGFRRTVTVMADFLEKPATAEFGLLPISPTELAPVWFIKDAWLTDGPLYDLTVSADATSLADGPSGRIITAHNNNTDSSYRVYSAPQESPIHTAPAPPADARVVVSNPEDLAASPLGWFDLGSILMDGNNVHACADRDGNNVCDAGQPTCPGEICDFPVNLNADPSVYTDAAIANLFYWNNHIHDVQYKYGFDEFAGNFQENNFGKGGLGSDSVNAQAQDNADGGSRCNANFATPSDGNNPRMQMFVCNNTAPQRDGDFDNGVIVHEYGHGISIRQVGGPAVSCLNNAQQAGEGWSDWFGLVYTAQASQAGPDARGLGSYLFGLPPDGTIRPQQYSTDPAINTYTYESINGLSVPHGVGSVWAQALWEVYWKLVDKHGFENDLLDFNPSDPSESGNKRALFYVNEGLKNTACTPTFVANRNGIIAAAQSSFGGEDVCDIWEVFAGFGLGANAISGGSGSTTPTNGFDLPTECTGDAWGYVWSQSTTGNFVASPGYSRSSAFGPNVAAPNEVTTLGVGQYRVDFPDIGGPGGTVHVTAYGSNARCKVQSWGNSGTTLRVNVRCHAPDGTPVGSRFAASYVRETGTPGVRGGYVWANNPTAASYAPSLSYQWNSSGAVNGVQRLGGGSYRVSCPNQDFTGGTVQVTAYGTSSDYCKVQSWGGSSVNVRCFDANGNPADEQFTASYSRFYPNGGLSFSYAWANNPTSASYTPSLLYQRGYIGGDGDVATNITATRSSVGNYTVATPGMTATGSNPNVTAYGSGSEYCNLASWGTSTRVRCYTQAGALTDTPFVLVYTDDLFATP